MPNMELGLTGFRSVCKCTPVHLLDEIDGGGVHHVHHCVTIMPSVVNRIGQHPHLGPSRYGGLFWGLGGRFLVFGCHFVLTCSSTTFLFLPGSQTRQHASQATCPTRWQPTAYIRQTHCCLAGRLYSNGNQLVTTPTNATTNGRLQLLQLPHHPPLMEHPCTSSRLRGSIGIDHRDNGRTSCPRTSFYAVQTLNAAYSISTSVVKIIKGVCLRFVIYDSTEIKKLECVNRDAAPVSLSNTTVPAPTYVRLTAVRSFAFVCLRRSPSPTAIWFSFSRW